MKKYNALQIDGGGVKIVYNYNIIKSVDAEIKIYDMFDIFAGVSAGASLCACLALDQLQMFGKLCNELYPLFKQTSFVYSACKTILTRNPLYGDSLTGILMKYFGDITLGDLDKTGKYLIVSVMNLDTNVVQQISNYNESDKKLLIREVIQASMSIAGIFKIVKLNGKCYCDPGYSQTDNSYSVMKIFNEKLDSLVSLGTFSYIQNQSSTEDAIKMFLNQMQWSTFQNAQLYKELALIYSELKGIKYTRFCNGTNIYIRFDDASKKTLLFMYMAAKKDYKGVLDHIQKMKKE